MRVPVMVMVSLAFTVPALAQGGPSFDCARASTAVERAICKSADVANADREMAALYVVLSRRISGPARDHLAADQMRWNGARGQSCPGQLEQCLKEKYTTRIERLKFMASDPYPFVSDQAIVRSGKVKATRFIIDASYPQFDGTTADFSALNRQLATAARNASEQAVPDSDIGPGMDQIWTYRQNFSLYRPAANAISVVTNQHSYTGGAHGNGSTSAILVDLRTGRAVLPSTVFVLGNAWMRSVVAFVTADLRKQFSERPGFDEALEVGNIGKLLRAPGRWVFKAESLRIVFNAYEVGPYSAGLYEVEIPYTRIRSFLSPDGLLGR